MPKFNWRAGAVVSVAVASSLIAAWGFSRLEAAAAAPPPPAELIVRAPDGHFWAEAMVNGQPVRALVDTGASVVALTREDALRLGLELGPEDFDQWVGAAGGPARAARIQLAHVSVAGARVERVEAMVIEDGLPASLLGMSYLGRLSRIEATPAGLTLRP